MASSATTSDLFMWICAVLFIAAVAGDSSSSSEEDPEHFPFFPPRFLPAPQLLPLFAPHNVVHLSPFSRHFARPLLLQHTNDFIDDEEEEDLNAQIDITGNVPDVHRPFAIARLRGKGSGSESGGGSSSGSSEGRNTVPQVPLQPQPAPPLRILVKPLAPIVVKKPTKPLYYKPKTYSPPKSYVAEDKPVEQTSDIKIKINVNGDKKPKPAMKPVMDSSSNEKASAEATPAQEPECCAPPSEEPMGAAPELSKPSKDAKPGKKQSRQLSGPKSSEYGHHLGSEEKPSYYSNAPSKYPQSYQNYPNQGQLYPPQPVSYYGPPYRQEPPRSPFARSYPSYAGSPNYAG